MMVPCMMADCLWHWYMYRPKEPRAKSEIVSYLENFKRVNADEAHFA